MTAPRGRRQQERTPSTFPLPPSPSDEEDEEGGTLLRTLSPPHFAKASETAPALGRRYRDSPSPPAPGSSLQSTSSTGGDRGGSSPHGLMRDDTISATLDNHSPAYEGSGSGAGAEEEDDVAARLVWEVEEMETATLWELWSGRAREALRVATRRYEQMGMRAKVILWAIVLIHVASLITIIILSPKRILDCECPFLRDPGSIRIAILARGIRNFPLGWLLLISAMTVTAFPPVIGYGTIVTMAGIAYGMPGWFVAAAGCLIGSLSSFLVLRLAINRFAPLLKSDERFEALAEAVRQEGTRLVILIRLCPFPFTYSNLFFASVESVSLAQFLFATLLITPKLLLHVFIGSRMYELLDDERRNKMHLTDKILNGVYIVLGVIVSIFTGIFVYRSTMKRVEAIRARKGSSTGAGDLPFNTRANVGRRDDGRASLEEERLLAEAELEEGRGANQEGGEETDTWDSWRFSEDDG